MGVHRYERVTGQHAALDIAAQESSGIVTGKPHGRLGEVVGAEREEFGGLGDFAGEQRGARQLDHGADHVGDAAPALGEHFFSHRVHARLDQIEFPPGDHERDHDFRNWRLALLGYITRGLEHRARLHLVNLGIDDRQPAAAKAQHRIAFGEFVCAREQHLGVEARRFGDIGAFFFRVRQELMQRRIEQADSHRARAHDGEDRGEILALVRRELVKRGHAALLRVRQDHFAHRRDAFSIEEHMLGAAKPDALGAELQSSGCIFRGFSVGAHFHPPRAVRPSHQRAEITGQFRLHHLSGAVEHLT